MSTFELSLTHEQKKLATFGYIKQNSLDNVPLAINTLCLRYYDPIFYINIRGKLLKKYLQMKPGEAINKSFKYNSDIKFKCEIFPNGCFEHKKGNTISCITAIYDTNKISNIMYVFDMKCNETNSHYRYKKYGDKKA
eukprot:10712_1